MRAIEKYNGDSGNLFSTYATHWILHFQKRFAFNNQYLIRVPEHKKNDFTVHPKFFQDFEKVSFKVKNVKCEDENYDEFDSLNDFLGKLERVLKPLEFKILLARFALYHYKFPIDRDLDSPDEIALKESSRDHQFEGTLMSYRELGSFMGTSHER